MGNEKVGFWVVGVLVLVLILGSSAASDDRQQRWRKAMMSGETMGSSMLMNRVPSSIVLPLHGNVYPTGFYNVTLNIGQPSKPYFLDVDTGSDLTWLQCDVPRAQCTEAPHPYYKPSNNLVAWNDPICQSLHTGGDQRCENPGQCDYEVEYADGGSSLGVLVKDAFNLNFTSEKHQSPLLALGCGYDQLPGGTYHPIDGVLGLGRGKPSIVSQLSSLGLLRNVIGHCLSGRGGGFLFFGDDLYDSSSVAWTPMSPNAKHYSPGFAELTFDGKTTGFINLIVAFDSGASYTYLNSQAYQGLISLIKRELSTKPLREALDDQTLPICWKGRKPFKSVHDVNKYFKTFALSFANDGKSKTQLEFPPEAYLIVSSKGNACLGVLNGTEVGLNDLNVIGDISMQDRVVIYDNEKQLIGWAPRNCDRIPKSRSIII
ncbi:aspartic proteinase Asp1 isoform X5 [Populus trichocarpa]|uniref:aspartic proteinase Asp1 isoform X5 n=1 Tax=Populus trichocarpa TaxID=3694 RepID=UPI0022790C2E|nr:aspartic proteinase Asp1 isoform X5 [Populus trichocarpa]